MNREFAIYKFLKRCETPPLHSCFWLFMSLLYNTSVVLLGKVLLYRLQRVNRQTVYVLFPVFSNGDLLVFYRSMSEFERANDLNQFTIIIANHLLSTAKALGIVNVEPVSNWRILAMSKASSFYIQKRVIVSQPWHFFDLTCIRDKSLVNSFTTSTNSVIHDKLPSVEYWGRCVVLSPYEQSFTSLNLPRLPQSFWVNLCLQLQERGFRVLTNCNGQSELPIKGTEAFFPPIIDIAGAIELAGYSISVRSGFTDWCSGSPTAKQVVLYPSKAFLYRFSMRRVWGREDILEIVYGDDLVSLDKLTEKVLSFIGSMDDRL